ncbi:MAG: 16S rRNA methyltransferase [Candidatus Thorarchaeota archaeon]
MLHLILLDCALELVPSEISSMKHIQKQSFRRGKKPNELLLDQTHHGQSMTKLSEHERRGRPDIIFLSLMSVLETPLCKEGLLRVYLHLQDGKIVEMDSDVRLPRNYDRFVGLMEQLFSTGRVPPKGDVLLQVTDKSLDNLISDIGTESTYIATESGRKTTISQFADLLPTDPSVPVVVGVGAFPHGHMADSILNLFKHDLALDKDVMMTWHVCSEILWAYSSSVEVVKSRFTTLDTEQ